MQFYRLLAVQLVAAMIITQSAFADLNLAYPTTKPTTQPAIAGTLLAGEITIGKDIQGFDIESAKCELYQPVKSGDKIAAYTCENGALGADTQKIEITSKNLTVPVFAIMKGPNGSFGSVFLSKVNIKKNIKIESQIREGDYFIYASREFKADEVIPVIYNPLFGAISIEQTSTGDTISPALIFIYRGIAKDKIDDFMALWSSYNSQIGK